MAAFAKELDLETQQETEKQEKNIEALARRKEELIQENKQKLKVGTVYSLSLRKFH